MTVVDILQKYNEYEWKRKAEQFESMSIHERLLELKLAHVRLLNVSDNFYVPIHLVPMLIAKLLNSQFMLEKTVNVRKRIVAEPIITYEFTNEQYKIQNLNLLTLTLPEIYMSEIHVMLGKINKPVIDF